MIGELLRKYVALGALAVGAASMAGCGMYTNQSRCEYNGDLDGERIITRIVENFGLEHDSFYMTVFQNDGTTITYIDDFRQDLRLDTVEVVNGSDKKLYEAGNSAHKPIMTAAQAKFEEYCNRIAELKRTENEQNLQKSLDKIKNK